MIALLALLSPHGAVVRSPPPVLMQLFPKADIASSPSAPDGRNAAIAALIASDAYDCAWQLWNRTLGNV